MLKDSRKLGGALQELFTTTVQELNQKHRWIQRNRGLSVLGWVRLLVFGWLGHARRNFADLAELAELSPQALQQRLTQEAVDLFFDLFQKALTVVVTASKPAIPLLKRFSGIHSHDSTQLKLPRSLAKKFPACGGIDGERGQAGWKILLRFDVLVGRIFPFTILPGKTSDHDTTDNPLADLKAGMLYLADLGYFSFARLSEVIEQGAHFVSRIPARVIVTDGLKNSALVGLWLKTQQKNVIDQIMSLGNDEEFRIRFVAIRLPKSVAQERRRKLRKSCKRRDREVSKNQLALCDWWVGLTDLPVTEYSVEEIQTLYSVRWQVELLFKHWKSAGGLGVNHGRIAESVQVEYLAKLVGIVVKHWSELIAGSPLEGKNRMRVHRAVCRAYQKLAEILESEGSLQEILEVLRALERRLKKVQRRPLRKKKPSTRQRLYGAKGFSLG